MKPALPAYVTTSALAKAFEALGEGGSWDPRRVRRRLRLIHVELLPKRSARGGKALVDVAKIREFAPGLYDHLLLIVRSTPTVFK